MIVSAASRFHGLLSGPATLRLLTFPAAIAFLLAPICAQAPQLTAPFTLSLEVMSDSGEADLRPFLQRMYKSIKQKAVDTLPRSVLHGEAGKVTIQLKLQKNGKLAVPPLVISSSGKETLDHHAMAAIRGTLPFDHLPDSTPVPLVLRFTFYYNAPPSGSHFQPAE